MASQIGLSVALPAYTVDPAFTARRAEELGFESIWFAEHPILPVESDSPFPGSEDGIIPWTYAHFTEPYIALARASAVTTDLKLGTGITLITERNPLVLAKVIAALDFYSGGRFQFGIGTGWHREETELMGGDFAHRWTQAREAALALKALWTEDEAEFHGKYYDFPPVQCYPKPAQDPHPPILLGGMARNVLRRVARWGDGWLPNRVSPEQVRESRLILDTLAAEYDRDPSKLTINVYGQRAERDVVESFLEAGANRVIVGLSLCESEDEMETELQRVADAVL